MNRLRIESLMIVITMAAGLAVGASIPNPYASDVNYYAAEVEMADESAGNAETAENSDGSLPDHTVTDVDVRRLALVGAIV